MKIKLSNLQTELKELPEIFICNASFEKRCLSVAKQIEIDRLEKAVVLWNQEYKNDLSKNLSSFAKIFGKKTFTLELKNRNPLEAADQFSQEVIPIIKNRTGLCLIDITTFTHEQLLITFRILFNLPSLENIKLLYSVASEYATNCKRGREWLSRGVSGIRAVLGYPGIMLPSRKLHLLILLGFEQERAEILIDFSEPAVLSLGRAREHQSVKKEYFDLNVENYERVLKFTEEMLDMKKDSRSFEFSCVDPIQTMNDLLKEMKNSPYNITVCPLNSKPSTVGAALASLVSDRVQLIYPKAVEYNVKGYSSPGEDCYIFDLQELFKAVEQAKKKLKTL